MPAKTHHDKTGLVIRSNSFSHYPLTTHLPCSGSHTHIHTLRFLCRKLCHLQFVHEVCFWVGTLCDGAVCDMRVNVFDTHSNPKLCCYSPQQCLQQHGLINLLSITRKSERVSDHRSLCVLHVRSVHLCVYFSFSWWLCDVVVVCVCVWKQSGIDCLSHTLYIPWMKWVDTVNPLK